MNVWILSVRELARLLRGRLTWLAAALTVLSPLAGLTVYRSASADTMQSLYVANPALAGGVLGGLFFALLTLCDCARTSRCRVEVLCDAAVSPLTAALARLMALLGTAALTLALTLLTWLPWTAHTVGAVFDGGDYLLAYLILMGLALPLCILLAGAAWQFTRRFDLSLVLVAALAALSLTIWRDNWQLCWLNPCVWALSDDFSNFRILRSAVETVEHGEGENELEVVRRVYEDTLRQKVSLSQEVAEMAPIVRERLYKNLLRGKELPETYLLDRLAYLHSPFQPDGIFAVLAGAVDDSYDGNPDELMGDLYRRLSQELQPSVSCQPYSCEYLLMDDYSLVLILAFPHSASAAQIKAAELEQSKIVQEYARQNHVENLFTLGRGKPCRGITNLHYSYVEALESLNYQHYHGSGAEEEQDQQSGCRQCVELAKSGDIDGAKRAFDVLLQEAAHAAAGSLSPLENCSAMLDCMVEALLNLHVPEEKLALFESYYRRAEQQTGSELFVLASRVGTEGLSLLAYYGQKNRNRYVAQAQKYIQERCVDSHLSLEMVADSVGITPAYLSRLFYELSEVNFVNYVNECRVQRAKLLLRQSKIPVQEVGFRCGFNSLQNFNRVFKRHTGTTPGAYRKQ